MSKSIKLKNDDFIDATGIIHRQQSLSSYLDSLARVVKYFPIGGYLTTENMFWRILKLPSNFCGFLFLITNNRSGIMQNNIIKITNSYGAIDVERISGTTFGNKVFSTLRLVYKVGSSVYLELQANGILNQTDIHIGIVGMYSYESGFSRENSVGKVDDGDSVKSISL